MADSNSVDVAGEAGESEPVESFNIFLMQESLYLKLAMHYAPYRWRGRMKQIIDAVDENMPLEQAVEKFKKGLPKELSAILNSALQLPEPGKFFLHSMRTGWERRGLLKSLTAALAYPMLLLLATLMLSYAANFVMAPVLIQLTEDFGLVGLDKSLVEDQQSASLGMLAVFFWCLLIGGSLRWIGPRWALLSVLGGLPYIGKAFRWISLYEILQRLDAMSQQGIDAMAAAERTAVSFTGSPLEASFAHISRRIESGVPIGGSLARSLLSDGLCGPILLALDHPNSGSTHYAHATKVLWRLSEFRMNSFSMILPFLIFVFIVNITLGTVSTFLGLLVNFIRLLSAF